MGDPTVSEIHDLRLEAQHRWLRPAEVCQILRNYKEFQIATETAVSPPSGSLFLYDRRVLRFFRKDGHNWRKKRDGKTVGEAHERLKCGSVDVLNCYYAHGEDNPSFQRRTYWLLEEGLDNIVLVHYRDIEGNRINLHQIKETEDSSSVVSKASSSYEITSSLPYNIHQGKSQIPSQTTVTSSYSSLTSDDANIEPFDMEKDEHAEDVEEKLELKKIHHLHDQPQEIHDLLLEAQYRWLRPAEVCQILRNYKECQITTEPAVLPPSGSLFLYDRRVLRFFRKDGHNWRKKRDGKTVGEAHERLKCGSVDVLNCNYAHGEDNTHFQRRTYWLLEEGLDNIVLVHYRDVKGNQTNLHQIKETKESSSVVTEATSSHEKNSSLPYNIHQEKRQIPSQTTLTRSYSCLISDDAKMEPFDMEKDEHAEDVEEKVKRKKIHHLHDQPQVTFSFEDGLSMLEQMLILKDELLKIHEVVLSFSHGQSEIIKPFVAKMLNLGIDVFSNVLDEDYLAIDYCKICIPIVSKEYLSETQCLHELFYIVEAQRNSEVMQIIPLFYDVDPCDVIPYINSMAKYNDIDNLSTIQRYSGDPYEVNLQCTNTMAEDMDDYTSAVQRYDVDPYEVNLHSSNSMAEYMDIDNLLTVQQWQDTLKEVVEIKGWEMKDKDFHGCINLISSGILNKLKLKDSTAGLVRMEDQIKKVIDLLNIESGSVLLVGIHGTSGVGKTSLAKLIFSELADQFEGCSFLHNIRETTENWGLKYLRDQLLRDIADKDIDHEEINRMEDKLLNKKVLIVLDDVNQREQINNLVGKGSSWFGSGSRIIVTTQDPRVLAVEHDTIDNILKWPKEVRTCELRSLMVHAPDLALQLFCKHAFGEDSPPYEYLDISISLLQAIGGIPLALEIVGSFLNRKHRDVWDSTLERLRHVPPLEVKEKLLISYESLEYETRQIFLDIACFFCNKDKTCPVYMWDSCNFFPRQGLEVLTVMCLVKIRDDNKLWMHDQVKEFGREMARVESFNLGLAWCSRLWVDEEALDALRRKEVDIEEKMEIQALSLGWDESLLDSTFTNESFVRTQHLRFLELQGAHLTGNFMDHLPNLRWLQWHSCPGHCEATNLQLYNLVILDLSRSQLSHEWSGWSQFEMSTKLKVLNLTSCKSLYRTPDFSSYTVLERLILEDCTSLVEVDESIGLLKELKYLNLNGCTSLNVLPRRIGELTSLLNLEMDGTGVAELPFDIGRLVKLNHLVLSSCFRIEQLPHSLGLLALLVHLDLGRTKITELPESIRNMKMLKVLKIEYSSITRLSRSIGMLERLEELHARHCEDLAGDVPDEVGGLFNLRVMDLSFSKVCSLPRTIRQLYRLQTLHLESCNELLDVPELPLSLVRLTITVNLQWQRDVAALLPGSSINNARGWTWIKELSKLETLELCVPNITELELHAMSQLRSLSLSCQDLELFPQFPASLTRLFLVNLKDKTQLTTLGNLKKLAFSEFNDCSIRNGLESLGVGQIESLEHLSASRCSFISLNGSNLPKSLRVLRLSGCELLHELDLTGLINLIHLDVTSCNTLTEIRGVGELLCLEEVSICSCDLLEKLGNLSNLEKLEGLQLNHCKKLKEVEGLDKIKSLKNLQICGCKSLENFHDKSGVKKQKRHLRIKA